MTKSRRAKSSPFFWQFFFDACLLLLFIAQAFIVGCLLAYGYIPLPVNWANADLAKRSPKGLRLEAEQFRLKLNGEVEVIRLKVYSTNIRLPIFEAEGAVIDYQFSKNRAFRPGARSLVLVNGTLYLPGFYSPDGVRTSILKHIALRIAPEPGLIRIESFAAMHEDIRLRGALEWPLDTGLPKEMAQEQPLDAFYRFIADGLKEKARFAPFKDPTLTFNLRMLDDGSVHTAAQLSSPELNHSEVTGKDIRLEASVLYKENTLVADAPLRLQARKIEIPRFHLSAGYVAAHVAKEDWPALLQGTWPDFKISAQRLTVDELELEAPNITVQPHDFPEVRFAGSTNGLKGAVAFSGTIDTQERSGAIHANGSVDLLTLIPPPVRKKMPPLIFETAPYYDMSLYLNEGFEIDSAEIDAQTDNLSVEGLHFDHIRAKCRYKDGLLSLREAYIKRGKQWLDFEFSLNTRTTDYRVALVGSAVPYEYNPILPRWWAAIFRDFKFTEDSRALGDFIIYGKAANHVADLYFGHVRANKVSFKSVPIDEGELIVRGMGRYAEVHQLNARTGNGWVRGDLAFTSFQDAVRAPASIRFNFEGNFPLDAAGKIFGENIARTLGDFETDISPYITLNGVSFNKAYPQFNGLGFFNLTANANGRIKFHDVPLDHMDFKLMGREGISYLRDLNFGYAGGTGSGSVDILTPRQGLAEIRFKLGLKDAGSKQALEGLSKSAPDSHQNIPEDSRFDLEAHARGPAADPYHLNGYGSFAMRGKELASIDLLGPLSKILKNTRLDFTSLKLTRIISSFRLEDRKINFDKLRIEGPLTRIDAKGSVSFPGQELDMEVNISPLANLFEAGSGLKKLSEKFNILSDLLEFQLTGTVKDQKWRSTYDPRNLLPKF